MLSTKLQNNTKPFSLLNIFVFLFSLLLIFMIVEVSFRLLGMIKGIDFRLYIKELKNSDRLPEDLFIEDSVLGYRLKSDVQVLATTSDFSVIYKINSKGLRDKDYYYNRTGKIRLLAFGDSFTFGEGVNYGDRFTDVPEGKLSNIEIINFGIPGYGLDQVLLYFVSEGIKYNPDYVIIFINNVQIARHSTEIVKNDSLKIRELVYNQEHAPPTYYIERNDTFFNYSDNFILKNSYFISYLNYQINLLKLKTHLREYDRKLWKNIREINKQKYSSFNISETEIKTKLIMKEFLKLSKLYNFSVVMIKIDPHEGMDLSGWLEPEVLYYDLSTELRNFQNEHSLSFVFDSHYTPQTHNLIGNNVTRIIEEIIIKKKINP